MRFSPSGSPICSGRAQSAAGTTKTARRSCFCRSPSRGCCCRSSGLTTPWLRPRGSGGGMMAARGRPAPTCSSARCRTPPPSTPTPRHMMCTLGRPIPRTANETTPNIVSVVTFCNQATALLRSPPAAAKDRDAYIHTWARLLNFSGTAQNWMASVAPTHCPLPCSSTFLELDYQEQTYHAEDLSYFSGASPKLDAKSMVHHHDNLLMLMVESHGCIGR